MGLIVLALRCYLVFQNIYVTFKTLKTPPPSSRNNGQPSLRAMTQRKRDMKGCMAIWIVWCCFATYEAVVERLISIFIPFYDEIKSVILVFFILARARGAEPIYLHVIRPLLKPYVSTLDAVLDLIHNIGDFVLLVVSLPFQPLLSWWNGRTADGGDMSETDVDGQSAPSQMGQPSNLADETIASNPRSGPAYNLRPRQDSKKADLNDAISRFYSSPAPAPPLAHEIWHPPPSAFDDPPDYDSHIPPGPRMSMPEPVIPSLGGPQVDDWRMYPPFPSAYPPTPVVPTAVPQTQRGSIYPSIPEHQPISNSSKDDRQDFGQSLLLPREPANPGSVGSLSDDMQIFGVQDNNTRYLVSDDSYDNHDGYETEEDSFDVTLRTPFQLRAHKAAPVSRAQSGTSTATAATDVSSTYSHTTGLSTVGYASSLRTRTSSQATSVQASDSSVVGKKRPLPRPARIPVRHVAPTIPRTPGRRAHPNGTGRSRRVSVRPSPPRRQRRVKEDIVDLDSDRSDSDESSLAAKRRRVGTTSRQSKVTRAPPIRTRTTQLGNGKRTVRSGTTAKATITRPDSVSTRASVRTAKARAAAIPASRLPRASGQASTTVGDVGQEARPKRRGGTGNKRTSEGRWEA